MIVRIYCITLLFVSGFWIAPVHGQSFLERTHYGISITYGYGKIQYYSDYIPVYVTGSNEDDPKYSPSWQIKMDGTWWMSNRLDLSFGICHVTITERYDDNLKPSWAGIGEEHLVQGFLHLSPSLNIKLPDDRFKINLGVRLGIPSFFGNTNIQGSSNALGKIHADICLENGFSLNLSKKFSIEVAWIEGISKYDYSVGMPVASIDYFKYRTFLFGIKYKLYAKT